MAIAASAATFLTACSNQIEMRRPDVHELPPLPEVGDIHTFKAPLYWSVYEYCYTNEQAGIANQDQDIKYDQWERITDWLADEFLPYGYDMVCTDGFIPMLVKGEGIYMTHYGSMALTDLVDMCKKKGLKVGVYDNPLWLHAPVNALIPGTDIRCGDLLYKSSDKILNPDATDGFNWIVATHDGAREYIDGFFKHYHELGIDFIRMDFMSWYEDGLGHYSTGAMGRGYGRDVYARALCYIAESAKKYGVFTSIVMPHLYDDAVIESKYCNMTRISRDTFDGGWQHASAQDRGKKYNTWPMFENEFDGFVYYSPQAGRGKIILDGDFMRLNKFASDDEKKFVISLQLMAGGPVAIADQISTIGDNGKFYTNTELLSLNTDRFVGKPLTNNLADTDNQIWYGQMTDGSVIAGLFNREETAKNITLNFSDLGLSGTWAIRDLWAHSDEGSGTSLTASIPAHGCKIVKLTNK